MKPQKVKELPIDAASTDGEDAELRTIFDALVNYPHDDLRRCRFALVWQLGKKPSRDGIVSFGQVKKPGEALIRILDVDLVVYVNRHAWQGLALSHDDPEIVKRARRFVVDCILMQCSPDLDDGDEGTMEQKEDATGRLLWRVIPFDLSLLEGPVSRHGLCLESVRSLARVSAKAQRELPFGDGEVEITVEHGGSRIAATAFDKAAN
jgi:hypothetical protein